MISTEEFNVIDVSILPEELREHFYICMREGYYEQLIDYSELVEQLSAWEGDLDDGKDNPLYKELEGLLNLIDPDKRIILEN